MRTLVIGEDLWRKLHGHLLADDEERVAFLLVKPADPRFVAHDVALIPDHALQRRINAVTVELPALIDVMNRAVLENSTLVEAHSHPLSHGRVAFSPIDDHGQAEMVAYLSDVMAGRPYGAIVVGHGAVQGRMWHDGEVSPIDRILVSGDALHWLPGDGTAAGGDGRPGQWDSDRYDRQVRAFGPVGQDAIASTRVAIVGLGGIGSIVALELSHLGVRDIVLIDADAVEDSNLNRLEGSTPDDVERLKVELAADQFLSVNPEARVGTLPSELRESAAIEAAASADVLFGCVDTDSGRLILNELAVTHAIPYIDCGAGIFAPAGSIQDAGGQVIVWTPGRPCLLCCGEVDRAVAAEELESPEQRAFRRREGYVVGTDVPEPAVMSLNGTIASLAVTEFLALVTGFRQTNHYTYYDMVEQRVGPRQVKRDPRCFTCSIEGSGDETNLGRYSRHQLPQPTLRRTSNRAIPTSIFKATPRP